MASQGNRIYADGILRKQKNGPHLCTIQIVGDELLVKRATESLSKLPLASIETASNASTASRAKSSASVATTPLPSPPPQQQQLLAKLNMKTLFHPTDPLLLERNGKNSVVIHRLSETGRDGLLLMFENTLLLDHFLHSISIFKKDRGEELESGAKNKTANVSGAPSSSRSSIGRHSTDTLTAQSRDSHQSPALNAVVPVKQSSPRERQKKTEPSLSHSNSSPAAAPARPEWDSTPAGVYRTPQTPHATILFQSPSPVVPSATTSASARRGVRFDSESPPPTRTPPPDVPSRSDSTGAAAIVREESGQMHHHHHHRPGHNILSPSASGYYSSSPFYRTGSLGGRNNDHSDGVFSARAAHQQQQHQQRMPSLSYLSTASSGAATAFSRTTSTHVDAYLDRSSRIQHYMDTIQQSTLERERLLEDLFEERDRKRRAYLRQAEYTAADEDIKASVKDRFARSQPDSFLSPAAGARGVAPHVATTPLSSAAALRH
ncbi:Hypothetical protein, putative [Bodo saltans]|uniref:Uncharacterized protein n=1 Tax=Bodo saltans TaxID=75058 RepID=A0A0S4IYB7_BODSA|nr:Hypothetical protein, putative [Bodo saltans]|eukprot:CUF71458.1 Hypothetical protein, putative [Bodo saltans]